MPSVFEKDRVLFDRIKLVELFDNGGQAEIWKVIDLDFPSRGILALKLRHIPADERHDAEFRKRDERLEAEVNLIGSCHSNYIVSPHFKIGGIEEADGRDQAYFGVVMDFAPDGALNNLFGSKEFSRFTGLERVKLLQQLAYGVQAMQHDEIIHNDIKPPNILIFREAGAVRPAYADFGYAFKRGETVVFGGTPLYMAPELVLKEAEPSFASDIFSLGVVFYELMMGCHPFEGIVRHLDPMTALKQHWSTDNSIDFTDQQRMTAGALVALIERMCARDPRNRDKITDVLDELEKIIMADPSWNSVNLDQYYPDLVGRYRWADSLHHLLNEKEVLVFLRGGNRRTDHAVLADWLKAERMFGFSILTLFGESDDLLRLWRRPADRAALDAVLKRFEAERGPVHLLEPKYHWPRSASAERLGLRQMPDVITYLDQLSRGPLPAPRKASAIVAETKSRREKGRDSKAIRAVCRAVASKTLSNELAELIGERIYTRLANVRVFNAVEVFVDPGSKGIMAEFVIIVETLQFHRIPEILDVVETTLKMLTEALPSRTATHFELEDDGRIESYDGRLLYELFRFHKSNRSVTK